MASLRLGDLRSRLERFVNERCIPAEGEFQRQLEQMPSRWQRPPIMGDLQREARDLGLWNLFLPKEFAGEDGLTNEEYAPLCEIMGRSALAPEACNCSAPDTGNMEVLLKYGTPEQQEQWLRPLLEGQIRSAFFMTEPAVASSDATNIETEVRREGDSYVITGRKWWSTGAMDERCKVGILMGKTDATAPKHRQQTMVLVPMDTPGVQVLRPLTVFGYDDAPVGHAEVAFEGVRVPTSSVLLGEGRGFEIAQGRLGPGRIHHCMRALGLGERALESLAARARDRVAFGRPLIRHTAVARAVADARIRLDQARLLVLHAARRVDAVGGKGARKEVAMIKIVVPRAVLLVLDDAIQVHGGAGVSQDHWLAEAYAKMRTLRIADGPDDVHYLTVARQEVRSLQARL